MLSHSSTDRHMGFLHLLVIVNNATVNTCVHVLVPYFNSFGYILRNGIVGSYSNLISFFKGLSNCFPQQGGIVV